MCFICKICFTVYTVETKKRYALTYKSVIEFTTKYALTGNNVALNILSRE